MFISTQALEVAQLDVALDENGLSINGRDRLPKEVQREVHNIAKRLNCTPQEHDELMSYVAHIKLWDTLKRIMSI